MTNTCPQCRKDDMIQKVTAIHSAGIASGSYSGPTSGIAAPIDSSKQAIVSGYTTLHGTSQTDLSRKLSPPIEPSAPSILGGIIGSFILIGGIVTLVFSEGESCNLIPGFLLLGIGLLVMIPSINSQGTKEKTYKQEMQRWKNAMSIWDRLYYCARDDCVFDPTSGEYAPIEKINYLIHLESK